MFTIKPIFSHAIAALVLGSTMAAPMTAVAQSKKQMDHRQSQKNQWRNLGYAGAALGAVGLLKGNGLLTILGLGGGLYAASRYEQDRKSQSQMQRNRAAMFSHSTIHKDGHTYKRRTVYKNGHKYYGFYKVK